MAEQAESGHVGCGLGAGCKCLPRGFGVERRHPFHGFVDARAGGLVAVVQKTHADRFRKRKRQANLGCIVAQEGVGLRDARDRLAVLRFGVIDAVTPDHGNASLAPYVEAPAQHLRKHLHGEFFARPSHEVDRDNRLAAHRVNI